jgi:hypothetical protein
MDPNCRKYAGRAKVPQEDALLTVDEAESTETKAPTLPNPARDDTL